MTEHLNLDDYQPTERTDGESDAAYKARDVEERRRWLHAAEKSTLDLFDALAEPFPVDRVEWRVQRNGRRGDGSAWAMALPYLDARDVMWRLDQVCGPDSWRTYIRFSPTGAVACELSVRVPRFDVTLGRFEAEWLTRTDVAGETAGKGMAEGDASKGAASNALKRAAVQFGVGRYLYDLKDFYFTPSDDEIRKGQDGKERVYIRAGALAQLRQQLAAALGDPDYPRDAQGNGAAPSTSSAPPAGAPAPSGGAPPAGGRGDSGGSDPTERADGRFGLVSAKEKKMLWACNFAALEATGLSKQEINALPNEQKYAPANYACGQLDVDRFDDLQRRQIDRAKGLMQEWSQKANAQPASTQAGAPDPDEPPPPEEPDLGEEPPPFDEPPF